MRTSRAPGMAALNRVQKSRFTPIVTRPPVLAAMVAAGMQTTATAASAASHRAVIRIRFTSWSFLFWSATGRGVTNGKDTDELGCGWRKSEYKQARPADKALTWGAPSEFPRSAAI